MEAEKVFTCDPSYYWIDDEAEDVRYAFLNGTLPKDVKNLVCANAVPDNIDEFVNLTSFTIVSDFDQLEIPTKILKSKTLTRLFIRGDVIIDSYNLKLIEDMCQLEVLSFDRCRDVVSLRLENLRNLRYLEVMRCNIKLVNLDKLINSLEHLVLKCSGMDLLPNDVYKLLRLKTLDISDTFVTNVSQRILGLVNLKYFSWSHYMGEVDELKLSRSNGRLPIWFREMMEIDISAKTFKEYLEEEYGEEESEIPLYLLRDFEEDGSGDEDTDDEDIDEEEIDINDYDSDEGYESDDGRDELPRIIVEPKNVIEKPEFYIDYISREDKRVPNWEFLFDEE